MEQSDTSETQVLKTTEGLSTDIDVRTTHVTEVVTDQNVKTAVIAEDVRDLPNVCKLPLVPVPSADDININAEARPDDYVDVGINDIFIKKTQVEASDHIRHKSGKTDPETYVPEEENIEIYEHIKDELLDTSHESEPTLSNVEEDQSLNVITESNTVEAENKVGADVPESDINTIEDESRSDIVDKQCPTVDNSLDEHSGDQIRDARESVEETIKEIHDNDGKRDSSIVTNAELTKLHEEETEVVVVLETIPVATDASAGDFIVTVDGKNADKERDRETVAYKTLQEKKTIASDHEINEFDNLIDYGQESDGTIIEVISTEVVHTLATEQREQQNNENCVESNKYDMEPVKITDEEIAIEKSIDDKNKEPKAIDSKNLISSVNKEDNTNVDATIIIDEKIIITEDVDSEVTDHSQTENAHENAIERTIVQQDEASTVDSSMKKRSVIQDIFDDWGVENADEDAQSTSRVHDSVEIELKSLLDETRTEQSAANKSVVGEKNPLNREYVANDTRNIDAIDGNTTRQGLIEQTENQQKSKTVNQDSTVLLSKNGRDSSSVSTIGKSSRAFSTTVPKNRSRHLTSQIASPAEVTEVLKERFREKQKVVVSAPRRPDIFFVKKITQRLSSKLAGSSVNPTSSPVPLPQQAPAPSSPSSASAQSTADNCDKKTTAGNVATETSKDGNSDNKELLAILEGDVDPDWSILKPPTLTEEGKTPSNVESDHSGPPKLDPLVEREMALKQLLELPVTPSKKNPSRKKKTFKPAPGKASKDADTKSPLAAQGQKRIAIGVDLASENARSNAEREVEIDSSSSPREQDNGRNEENAEHTGQNTRIEESRSGRKRKLTEKAREHEQNTIKRQKVYKGKVTPSKKQAQDDNSALDVNSTTDEDRVANDAPEEMDVVNNEKSVAKEIANKQFEDKLDPTLNKTDSPPLKRSKQSLSKRGPQPIAKRKVVVKKLMRQKISPTKKPVKLKTNVGPKKSAPKVVSKSQKRTTESTSGDTKPKKKIINEIDRLLQDEGVVNLLYDVEQPDKKRLIPITKSRAKVMDLQKVQRELKIRKKLVRNAVLRLRTSTAGVAKVSPRSKRTAVHPSDAQTDKKVVEQVASSKIPNAASPTEFILPAKIRNAADASIIIRRHSSSSFSSASGSPRVSVDAPEKPAEAAKLDDGAVHSLRSAKRRHSQDDKINTKKTKKRAVEKPDTDAIATNTGAIITATTVISTSTTTTTTATNVTNAAANNAEEKVIGSARSGKKSEMKKIDKVGKQQDSVLENITSSKVTTRSNGAATGKVTAKSKRAVKSKVTFVRTSDGNENIENSSKEEDELSACLAEAATALSIVGAGSRSGNTATTRKGKGKGKHFRITDIILFGIK